MKHPITSLIFVLLVSCCYAQNPPSICDCITAPVTDKITTSKCDMKFGLHNLIERQTLAEKATNCLDAVKKQREKEMLHPQKKLSVCECIYWESRSDGIRKKCERQFGLVYMSDEERKAYNAKRSDCVNSKKMGQVINRNKIFLDSLVYNKILHAYYYPEISVLGGNGSKSTITGYLQARTSRRGVAVAPLNVAVMERGKQVKTTKTDANGRYMLDLPHGKALTIVFSAKGYITQKLEIAPISEAIAISANLNMLKDTKSINAGIFEQPMCKVMSMGKRMGIDEKYHNASQAAFNKVYLDYEKQLEPGS